MPGLLTHAPDIDIRPAPADAPSCPCPYCPTGRASIPIFASGLVDLDRAREPRPCDTCGQLFNFRIRVVVEGAKISATT